MKSGERLPAAAAALALAPAVLWPLSNPDLFWHLSAWRRMRELGAIPGEDWLSWTRSGAAWQDFEWADQILFGVLHGAGGMTALWLFKAALMAGAALLLWRTLELYARPAWERAAAAALWGAAMLTRSDIRPELFSTLFFGALVLILERRRLNRPSPGPLALGALFCLWANLHPGFVYGLLLVALYAAHERDWKRPAAAIAGALLQRDPLGQAETIRRHVSDLSAISARITEWMPPRLDDPWHAPYFLAVLAAFAAALLLVRRRGPVPAAPLLALLFFSWSGSRHARMTGFAAALAVPLALAFLSGARVKERSRAAVLLLAACAAFSLWCGTLYGLGRTAFNAHFLPERAADYLAARPPAERLYNPWGWGGYLGWRLPRGWRVYQDGRYLFHDLLAEEAEALESPRAWNEFLDRRRIDVALLQNAPLFVEGRPWHEAYMDRARWRLVHEDARALVFERR